VDRATPATNCDNDDDPVNLPSPYVCDDEGDTPGGDTCGGMGQDPCEEGGGSMGSFSGSLPGFSDFASEHSPRRVASGEGFPAIYTTGEHHTPIGAFFHIGDATVLHVTKLASTYDKPVDAAYLAAHRFSPEVMRMVELVVPSEPLAVSESFNFQVPMLLLQEIGGDVQRLQKVAVGEKKKPSGSLDHSFIYLIRSQLATEPALQVELMLQVSVFARNSVSSKLERTPVANPSMALIDGGIDLSFDVEKPDFDADMYEVVYDVRAYRWADYEQDCADKTDNDGDGLSDCEDPDCANHPLCDSGEDGAGGGGQPITPGVVPGDDAGCSCGLVGQDGGLSPFAIFGLGGLALLWSSRRRRRLKVSMWRRAA
jgi:MYXO-CTERM domain-containing protein